MNTFVSVGVFLIFVAQNIVEVATEIVAKLYLLRSCMLNSLLLGYVSLQISWVSYRKFGICTKAAGRLEYAPSAHVAGCRDVTISFFGISFFGIIIHD